MLSWCPINTLPWPVMAVLTLCVFCRVTVKDTVTLAGPVGDVLDFLSFLLQSMIAAKDWLINQPKFLMSEIPEWPTPSVKNNMTERWFIQEKRQARPHLIHAQVPCPGPLLCPPSLFFSHPLCLYVFHPLCLSLFLSVPASLFLCVLPSASVSFNLCLCLALCLCLSLCHCISVSLSFCLSTLCVPSLCVFHHLCLCLPWCVSPSVCLSVSVSALGLRRLKDCFLFWTLSVSISLNVEVMFSQVEHFQPPIYWCVDTAEPTCLKCDRQRPQGFKPVFPHKDAASCHQKCTCSRIKTTLFIVRVFI